MNLTRRLDGKVALVTGASSGNGRAIALRFGREGASVVCADVRETPHPAGEETGPATHEAIELAGGRARFVDCDVADGERVRAAVREAVEAFGRLDVAVANAGINLDVRDLVDERFEDYLRIVNVNQHGAWWTCREAVRQMIAEGGGGRVIVIASIASLVGTRSEERRVGKECRL